MIGAISLPYLSGLSDPDKKRSDLPRDREDIYLRMVKKELGELLGEDEVIYSQQEELNTYRMREETGKNEVISTYHGARYSGGN